MKDTSPSNVHHNYDWQFLKKVVRSTNSNGTEVSRIIIVVWVNKIRQFLCFHLFTADHSFLSWVAPNYVLLTCNEIEMAMLVYCPFWLFLKLNSCQLIFIICTLFLKANDRTPNSVAQKNVSKTRRVYRHWIKNNQTDFYQFFIEK